MSKAVWKVDMVSLREGCIWRPGQDVQLEEGRQEWTCCWDHAMGASRNAGRTGYHRRAGADGSCMKGKGFKPHWQQLVFLKPYDHLSPSQRRTFVWRCHSGNLVLVSPSWSCRCGAWLLALSQCRPYKCLKCILQVTVTHDFNNSTNLLKLVGRIF